MVIPTSSSTSVKPGFAVALRGETSWRRGPGITPSAATPRPEARPAGLTPGNDEGGPVSPPFVTPVPMLTVGAVVGYQLPALAAALVCAVQLSVVIRCQLV